MIPPSNVPDTDVHLMMRVCEGDEEAFKQLVQRQYKNVLNWVYRYLGDRSRAEDLAQEVFLKVYRARKSYVPTAKFSTWLYHMVINLCRNDLRARKARSWGALPKIEGEPDSPSREDLGHTVRQAVDELPENQRMAVLLARFEEMSYEEIAETMGLSVEAVKSLLFRARRSLRDRLARYLKQ